MGEYLLRYSNKIESSDLRQCPYDQLVINKAYLSGITVRNIYESVTHKTAAKTSWHIERNYVTVTLCIEYCSRLLCSRSPTLGGILE